jgi:hypothetical protein
MDHRVIRRAVAVASLCAFGCSWDWDRYLPDSSPGADAGPDSAADAAAGMDVIDGTTACSADEECVRASPERPVCDARSGRCVPCTPARDLCGAGRFCTADNACAAGCGSDQACAAAPDDGGVSAGRCDPATHACVQCLTNEHCPVGNLCVARACAPGCDATRACPNGRTCCGGGCVDTATSASHCGACGALCTTANGAPACAASVCGVGRCNEPFGDCDRDPSTGCETNTRTAVNHCGSCGLACPARANAAVTCIDAACGFTCSPGFGDCDGDPGNGCETDLTTTLSRCGRCDNACSFTGGVGACAGGVCTRTACSSGRGDCDGNTANGCEVDLQSDAANCHMCSAACSFAQATAVCVAGACAIGTCAAGFGNCDTATANGCETDTSSSLAHCGACGRSCAFPRASATCAAGVCAIGACAAGAGNCDGAAVNGCEIDLTASVANCGRCGGACPARPNATATCAAGACGFTCAAGFANCDANAANGCETNTLTTLTACGACGVTCSLPNAVAACRAGACAVGACNAGFADCDGDAASGCETQPIASNQHCGRCGNACAAGRTCDVGRCALPGFAGYDVTASPGTVAWIDACVAPGAVQALAGADDELFSGVLAFPVEFWGATNFSYLLSSNGWFGFGEFYGSAAAIPTSTPYGHFGTLPRAGTPYPAAYVFGVDLVQGARGLCVATLGAAPNRRVVMQSTDASLYVSTPAAGSAQLPPSAFSFELIAYEGSGVLDMVYNAPFFGPASAPMIAPTNVTVGLQDFRMPLRAAVYSGTITGTTRIRFTPR